MGKITFFGNIMCEPLLLRTARRGDGGYDFDGVFENVKPLLDEADFVVGNLETPLAGPDAGYTRDLFSFNTPDAFADSIRRAGFSLVTTANNHCLDRGMEGLKRTVRVLGEKGIPCFGTWERPEDRTEAHYFSVDGRRIALISCTYGTNYAVNHCRVTPEEEECISLLHAHTEPVYKKKDAAAQRRSFASRAWRRFLRQFSEENRTRILKALHQPYNWPREDDFLDLQTVAPYMDRLRQSIRAAREKADLVLFNPHVGGQFNIDPGPFTQYVIGQALEAKCDAIVASHPHIVQRAGYVDGIPCFYSIGNFGMSPNSVYLLHEHLPEYGLAVHLYVESGSIRRTTFSILKMVEEKNRMLTVYPVDAYLKECRDERARMKLQGEVGQVYRTVTGKALKEGDLRREYDLARA